MGGYRFFFSVLVLSGALSAETGRAVGFDPTVGWELTLTSDAQIEDNADAEFPKTPENTAALKRYKRYMKELGRTRGGLHVKKTTDSFGVRAYCLQYDDGFKLTVAMDHEVLEFTGYERFSRLPRWVPRLQSDVYDVGARLHPPLEPRWDNGGGHLHLGLVSAFGRDVLLARNWLADQANHFELATGAYTVDPEAKPFLSLTPSQKEAFARLLDDTDRGKIRSPKKLFTAFLDRVLMLEDKKLLAARNERDRISFGTAVMRAKYWQLNVLRAADFPWKALFDDDDEFPDWDSHDAYWAFAVVEDEEATLEQRSISTQLSAEQMYRDAALLVGRLNYLRLLRKPVPLSAAFLAGKLPSIAVRARMFREYVEESVLPNGDRLDPAHYLQRLEKGAWRRAYQQHGKTCARKLEDEG